ncbi:aminoglycoside phosphotransferase family protein [Paenibacillus sp. FSL R7-0337]|uniref:phosphotransferase family protein n=1 Tax=Paenibacillus sp. FSL R7-0337 TaxID=1926588 RepID=UPI00096C7735|nr:aminoglycoside phosphotransferase family protein [Paenibacillus sp. FSL R7-0337]OMG00837.1 aminoglycoside phosphotransferase [Paenibacillus sp. FSL R7-0337]
MKSTTKFRLSETQIAKLVEVNFKDGGQLRSIQELKGGMFNAAYLIERTVGLEPFVLKVSSPPEFVLLSYEHHLMQTEVEVYHKISAETSIPAPRVICSDFSRSLIPSDYFFMSALKGQSMHSLRKRLSQTQKENIKSRLGDYFAQLHQIRGNYFGYFTDKPECQFSSWKEAYRHMLKSILADGERLKVKLPYERIERVVSKQEHLLEAVTSPSLISFDLWPGNIMLVPNGNDYEIEAIIDFERSFWGDPYADFPPAFLLFKDVREEQGFWKSYTGRLNDNKVLDSEDLRRIELYKLYIFLIMSVETYRYGFIYGKLQYYYSQKVVNDCLKSLEL